ncbi:PA14 domain-containing protein [Paraliomyxa miuraensis]|uniref:PA14 domain-containing protein n=1 Tax=Paraliomyxa miuraensis TaxID=376150 RepID=UPI002258D22D|nr:PA14 domain-containing protein [Paraliomyxa miuraensis]MCX4244482.1 PA14 domain-containing protein [Paraliomyxa miuraensis]
MTKPDHARVLDAAAAELRSAYTLIADPDCDPVTAMPHLRRAWQTVAWLSREQLPPDDAGEDLSSWLSAEHLPLIPDKERQRVHRTLVAVCRHPRDPEPWGETEPPPTIPSTPALVSHLRTLGRLVEALRLQQLGRPPKAQLAMRWGLRTAAWVGGVTAFILLALRPWQAEDVGSWRGAYYPTEKFEGRPDVRRDVDVDFDWEKDPPTDSIPSDRFGARWDTCLVIDEEVDAAFQVVSDDGARIILDGKIIVDNWEKHRPTAKGKRIPLSAGVHHLRIEYFEFKYDASIHVTASFDEDEPPSPIPSRILEFPGMEFPDDANPCEGKR